MQTEHHSMMFELCIYGLYLSYFYSYYELCEQIQHVEERTKKKMLQLALASL